MAQVQQLRRQRNHFALLPALILMLPLISACQSHTGLAQPVRAPGKIAIIEAYVEAYNEGDADAMAVLMHPDIEWIEPSDAGPVTVTQGRETLVDYLRTALMTETPVTSTMSDMEETEDGVRAVETASWWVSEDKQAAMSAPVIYTVSGDGLIRRVEYLSPSDPAP